jgi:hypothetical protein
MADAARYPVNGRKRSLRAVAAELEQGSELGLNGIYELRKS